MASPTRCSSSAGRPPARSVTDSSTRPSAASTSLPCLTLPLLAAWAIARSEAGPSSSSRGGRRRPRLQASSRSRTRARKRRNARCFDESRLFTAGEGGRARSSRLRSVGWRRDDVGGIEIDPLDDRLALAGNVERRLEHLHLRLVPRLEPGLDVLARKRGDLRGDGLKVCLCRVARSYGLIEL
eukprot:Amastigsp_a952_278.p4 type:complete len:183 gc:universal Amastigsp_a952_278:999-451(-)